MRRNSRFTCVAAMAISLCALLSGGAQAATLNSGWWVILGSIAASDNNFTPQVEARVHRVEAAARNALTCRSRGDAGRTQVKRNLSKTSSAANDEVASSQAFCRLAG